MRELLELYTEKSMIARITTMILFLLSSNDVRSDNPIYDIFQDS